MSVREHKKCEPSIIRVGVISVSTTRSINNDESGQWIVKHAKAQGHSILLYSMVKDDKYKIREKVLDAIGGKKLDVVLLTGGTGITVKDVTVEALSPIFSKTIPGFSHMFTQLSYREIGSAAIISRACGGIIGHTAVFCMPGSKKACELACKKLIFPELGHIVSHTAS